MRSQTSDPTSPAPIEDVPPSRAPDSEQTAEWLEALDQVIGADGAKEASELLQALLNRAAQAGVTVPLQFNTPYVNTIPANQQVAFPGDRALELRIESLIRYNALAMVARANKNDENIGGHMASFASLATLFEVGFNHFFRGSIGNQPGDLVYFQGHSSPGIYARAFLEGRLTRTALVQFPSRTP